MTGGIYSIYESLEDIKKRLEEVEKKTPDNYIDDIFEIGRNIGLLTKRVEELERRLNKKGEK